MATKLKVNYEFVGDSTTPVTRTESIKHGDSMLNTVINAAAATVNTKADKSYVDTELAKKANAADVTTALSGKADNTTVSALDSRVGTAETNIATQTARIDEIASLPEGSTTGDAELIDIRVGADGKTYTSAGNAVRGQVSDVKSELAQLNSDLVNIDNSIRNDYEIVKSFEMATEEYGYKCKTQFLDLTNITEIFLDNSAYKFYVVFEDNTSPYGWQELYTAFSKDEHTSFQIVVARKDGNIIYSDERASIGKKLVVKQYGMRYDKSCYISPNGSDSNDGTFNHPYATIQKGINNGYGTIILKSGTYTGGVAIKNREMINIVTHNPYDTSSNVYIDASGKDYGILIDNVSNVTIKNITVSNSNKALIKAMNVGFMECYNVSVSDNNKNTLEHSGFELFNVNGVFNDCKAINIDCDGFNMHGYGDTIFNNCVAYNCSDDGISHHDTCTGFINGGEYSYNGKAGIAPAYGASVNMSGTYSHNNTQYGLLMYSTDTSVKSMNASNSVFKSNGVDISVTRDSLTTWNCKYDTKNVSEATSYVEY